MVTIFSSENIFYLILLSKLSEIVKVGNYATHRRLSDLVENKLCQNYNKRKDIQRFGRFVLELVSGIPTSDHEEVEIPVSLPPDLCEFLKM